MNKRQAIILALLAAVTGCDLVKLPDEKPVAHVSWSTQQNWSLAISQQFYHTAQGSEIVPYAWLIAVEQPVLPWTLFGEVPLFMSASYISRLGFLPSPKSQWNPDALAVGFVKDDKWRDPHSGESVVMAGLTCATCHTGQLEITQPDGSVEALRVDGGPAMIDLQRFEKALGTALVLTDKLPFRFDRFAHRVLGEQYSNDSKDALKTSLNKFIDAGLAEQKLFKQHNVFPNEPGFGRVDALNRIGNQVFGVAVNPDNLYTANAPVAYPHLWGAGWFDYVQYNGSVPEPLVRNVGEALGVKTPYVAKGKPEYMYKSAVHVDNLWRIEQWLSGPEPYQGLRAPVWPEVLFGKINAARAEQGKQLYNKLCAGCHLPGGEALAQDRVSDQPLYWRAKNFRGDRLLQLKIVNLESIGTDPKQATDFIERQVDTGDMGKGKMLAGAALDYVTTKVTERYFIDNNIPEDVQIAWNNGHKLGAKSARVVKAYKARPLDGVWATPPFLHNGSVPSIYALLLPVEKRPKIFSLGSREFDVKNIGYSSSPLKYATDFDVTTIGNSNSGHEFSDQTAIGVIGPLLTDEQRYAIIEYLKTL